MLFPIDNHAELVLSDTGAGIPAEHLPKGFNRFYRADPARQSVGTGLGLAICQAIVESHDGTIHLESDVGRGTKVTVRFARWSESQSRVAYRLPTFTSADFFVWSRAVFTALASFSVGPIPQ